MKSSFKKLRTHKIWKLKRQPSFKHGHCHHKDRTSSFHQNTTLMTWNPGFTYMLQKRNWTWSDTIFLRIILHSYACYWIHPQWQHLYRFLRFSCPGCGNVFSFFINTIWSTLSLVTCQFKLQLFRLSFVSKDFPKWMKFEAKRDSNTDVLYIIPSQKSRCRSKIA